MPEISDKLFNSFSDLIYSLCGIYLPLRKKMMLTARLLKRLSALGISTLQEYYDYLLTSEGSKEEIIKMIDAVTTNKTEFFRDQKQFDYLSSKVLPSLLNENRISGENHLNIWSAGCSTGEEPYTIAIVLAEFYEKNNLNPNYSIIATDISTRVLNAAQAGIYKSDIEDSIPKHLLYKYFNQIKKNKKSEEYQVNDELKKQIKIINFNLIGNDFGAMKGKDIIFCRNVIIYFNKKIQIALFDKFYNCLKEDGYLFLGSSESLFSISNRFRMIAPSVYVKASFEK